MTCWRCKATGHYRDNCTAELCDRCGGRGHESSKCGSPEDMVTSLVVVEDPGDVAVETMAF